MEMQDIRLEFYKKNNAIPKWIKNYEKFPGSKKGLVGEIAGAESLRCIISDQTCCMHIR